MNPIIIAFYDGDETVKCLSNFAITPFVLDGISYKCVEGFWQSLKTEFSELRARFSYYDGIDAKQAGKTIRSSGGNRIFTYMNNLYSVGSYEHHVLLERAIRAKIDQNSYIKNALISTGNTPLKHMLKNKFGQYRPGDSPALSAITFESILRKIRTELLENTFVSTLPLPAGLNTLSEYYNE